MTTIRLALSRPHAAQQQVIDEARRFNVLVAGRRFGKSRLGLKLLAEVALAGRPCAWCSPTYKNLAELWREALVTLQPVTRHKSETERRLELITGGVIEFWSLENPDVIRGRRYARVVVDEAAMVRSLADIWSLVLRPTLIDYEGDAYMLSTPKGRNDFMTFYELGTGDDVEWASWRFPSSANPHLPPGELENMAGSYVTRRAYEQEIEARFIEEVSGALWKQSVVDACRVASAPDLKRVVVAIDPAVSAKATSDETGIVAAGIGADDHAYVLADASGIYSPLEWARKALAQYDSLAADRIIAEVNNGGDLVKANLRAVRSTVPYRAVHASRGKAVRAEPVAAMYEQNRVHHVGLFSDLELQMTTWSPADDADSPDRVDALVWALTDLMLTRPRPRAVSTQG